MSKGAWGIVVAVIGAVAAALGSYLTYLSKEHEIAAQERQLISKQAELETVKNQKGQVSSPKGRYEWQVTRSGEDEGWTGYIQVDEAGNAHMQMWKWALCPDNPKRQRLQLLEQQPGNAVVNIPEPAKLHISIPVRFIDYDEKCHRRDGDAGLKPPEIIEGDIDQTIGYEGQVAFKRRDGQEPLGGMILVKQVPGTNVITN